MNKSQFQKLVNKEIAKIEDEYKEYYESAENKRQNFVSRYNIAAIKELSIDDYVITTKVDTDSFCWNLQNGLASSGSMLGASPYIYGLYMGYTKDERNICRIRINEKWGDYEEEAFNSIKKEIIHLLENIVDISAIRKNKLPRIFKGKLIHTYEPELYANIFSIPQLKFITRELNMYEWGLSSEKAQRELARFRDSFNCFDGYRRYYFSHILYENFDFPRSVKKR